MTSIAIKNAIKHGDFNKYAKRRCISVLTNKRTVQKMLDANMIEPVTFADPRPHFAGKTITVYAIK